MENRDIRKLGRWKSGKSKRKIFFRHESDWEAVTEKAAAVSAHQ
jgi:hypothetical protein